MNSMCRRCGKKYNGNTNVSTAEYCSAKCKSASYNERGEISETGLHFGGILIIVFILVLGGYFVLVKLGIIKDETTAEIQPSSTSSMDIPPPPETVPASTNNNKMSKTVIAEYIRTGNKQLEATNPKYDLAISDFTKVIQSDPNNAEAYYGRGRAYLGKGDNSRAIADYTQAIRLNPNDAISYSNRGRAYARLGNYDQAVADFESAHRIDPNNDTIKQNLEKARRREGGL